MRAMKAFKGKGNIAQHNLNPGILGEQPGTDWIADRVGTRPGMDIVQNT